MIRFVLLLLLMTLPVPAQTPEKRQLGGRPVLIWSPKKALNAPVVFYSHGWRGVNNQSAPLMRSLAQAGYLVIAPNHKDALFGPAASADPQVSFDDPALWTVDTYRDRAEDMAAIWSAFKADPAYKGRFDPERLVLMGHSLGGYTMMGLSGAVPGWDSYGFKPRAVVCYSPFTTPYLEHGTLNLRAPIMYQGGTEDSFITPPVARPGPLSCPPPTPRAFTNTPSSQTTLQ